MVKLNLSDSDLNTLFDCINDCILRTSSKTKASSLESLKGKMLKANDQYEKEQKKKTEDKSTTVSKKSTSY